MASKDVEVVVKEIIENISKNNASEVKRLLSSGNINPNTCDEHGMSLLQHAAYKGNKDIVQFLLDEGAAVNGGNHEHQYTALHFGGLSGSVEICQILLNYGAKINAKNSVGRTPSQMSAFVGNHACVAVINNFINKSEVDYYTKTSPGASIEPVLVDPLHNFVIGSNVHPVKIALNLKKFQPLCDHLESVKQVLEAMSEKEIKRQDDPNEIISFKLHYFSCVVAELIKLKKVQEAQQGNRQSSGDDDNTKKSDAVELFIKKMLRVGRNGETLDQNSFLVDSIRSFHTRVCATFRHMVTTLARGDGPSPLSVVSSAINGQRAFTESESSECWTCGEMGAVKTCSKCKDVRYCDRECQRLHWFVHKKNCNRPTTSPERGSRINQGAVQQAVESMRSQFTNAVVN